MVASMIQGFLFNQRPHERDCAWRCLYSLLLTYGKTDFSYRLFLKEMRRKYGLIGKTTGTKLKFIYNELKDNGIDYEFGRPGLEGTFLMTLEIELSKYHTIIYNDRKIYDSLLNGICEADQFLDDLQIDGCAKILSG